MAITDLAFLVNYRRNAQADAVGEGPTVSKTELNVDCTRVCVFRDHLLAGH